jgi:hypothetical protein
VADAVNPAPEARNPGLETKKKQKPKPETRKTKPEAPNPELETQTLKSDGLKPEPHTTNQ